MPKISSYLENTAPDIESQIAIHPTTRDYKYRADFGNLNSFASRLKMLSQYNDLLGNVAVNLYPFIGTAIGAGTFAQIATVEDHPGIWRITSGAAANTGYNIGLAGTSSILIGGSEVAEFVIRFQSLTNVIAQFGFLDTTAVGAAVDGVYAQMNASAIGGVATNNSVASTTSTNYNVATGTWYRIKVVLNSTATRADFYVYNMAGTELWTDSVTSNIPTAAGRETGFDVKAYKTTVTATNLLDIDWMACYNSKLLAR